MTIKLYKKEINYVASLSQKAKKDYSQKHMPHRSSSKNFWKFCKLFFTNQIANFDDKIILVENEMVVFKNEGIAYLFKTNFSDITKELSTERWQYLNLPCEDPLVDAIRKYKIHPSILKIKSQAWTNCVPYANRSLCKSLTSAFSGAQFLPCRKGKSN